VGGGDSNLHILVSIDSVRNLSGSNHKIISRTIGVRGQLGMCFHSPEIEADSERRLHNPVSDF